ncbi:hypothetical protein SAMN02746065_10990 [Desulfocicer vacuolatum DSM 3385]|uniref:Uncharacterized protein n=1 Tax=Desulfocicer vacuolatum DSM 3385 TaxID=1121400 RepID=A0A1W2BTB4_9BACT|nr:hypothetical protein SAMN02746065_10990 [Desulfocicer vacuolatum DSM 3385]
MGKYSVITPFLPIWTCLFMIFVCCTVDMGHCPDICIAGPNIYAAQYQLSKCGALLRGFNMVVLHNRIFIVENGEKYENTCHRRGRIYRQPHLC